MTGDGNLRSAVDALLLRLRAVRRDRPRALVGGIAAGAGVLLAVIAFVSCGGPDGRQPAVAAPRTFFTAAPPAPTGPLFPSPTATRATDGCHGLITARKVSQAAGIPLVVAGADAASAASGYTDAIRAQGLDAQARLCPFTASGGRQVLVVGMTFANAGQAVRAYSSGLTGAGGAAAVPGLGDAAVTDRATTLTARHGRTVVVVVYVRPDQPDLDHTGPMTALARAALGAA